MLHYFTVSNSKADLFIPVTYIKMYENCVSNMQFLTEDKMKVWEATYTTDSRTVLQYQWYCKSGWKLLYVWMRTSMRRLDKELLLPSERAVSRYQLQGSSPPTLRNPLTRFSSLSTKQQSKLKIEHRWCSISFTPCHPCPRFLNRTRAFARLWYHFLQHAIKYSLLMSLDFSQWWLAATDTHLKRRSLQASAGTATKPLICHNVCWRWLLSSEKSGTMSCQNWRQ